MQPFINSMLHCQIETPVQGHRLFECIVDIATKEPIVVVVAAAAVFVVTVVVVVVDRK